MKYKLIDPKTIPMIYEITTDEGYHGTVTIANVFSGTLPTFTRINYPDGLFETNMDIPKSLFIWASQEKNFLKINIENNFIEKNYRNEDFFKTTNNESNELIHRRKTNLRDHCHRCERIFNARNRIPKPHHRVHWCRRKRQTNPQRHRVQTVRPRI